MFKTMTLLLCLIWLAGCSSIDKSKRVFKDQNTKPTLELIETLGEELESKLTIGELEKIAKLSVELLDDKPIYYGATKNYEILARVNDLDEKASANVTQVKFRFNKRQQISLRDVEVVFGKSSVRSLGPSTLLNFALPQASMAKKLETIAHVRGSGENMEEPIISILIRQKDEL